MANKTKQTRTLKAVRRTNIAQVQAVAAGTLHIPANLLRPIGRFLRNQLSVIERRRSEIEKDDPFSGGRADNMAATDANAAEQFGHARVEALKHELDRRIIQLRKALTRVKLGSYGTCESCSNLIDTDRLVIFPEAALCVSCEQNKEKRK